MAFNSTALTELVQGIFDVIAVLISEFVDLITGDLLVLAVVSALITFFVGLIYLLIRYIQRSANSSVPKTKMR